MSTFFAKKRNINDTFAVWCATLPCWLAPAPGGPRSSTRRRTREVSTVCPKSSCPFYIVICQRSSYAFYIVICPRSSYPFYLVICPRSSYPFYIVICPRSSYSFYVVTYYIKWVVLLLGQTVLFVGLMKYEWVHLIEQKLLGKFFSPK